ncbi:MAG TPA: HAD-IA family hydrolase [Acidimicrobiia bacterium]|nr:HAD-IA family hydrolase [Acidimicrobiia bacterium]
MPLIEAVLVDVGGVLVLPDHDRIAGAFERAGVRVDPARLDRAHYAGVAALTEFTEGDRDIWVSYNRAYARACGASEEKVDEVVEHLLNEFATGEIWSRTVPGSVDALRRLGALDVRLAIVSNADGNAEQRLRDDAICQVGPGPGASVEVILDSTVVGIAKPDPRIFDLALDALGVPATRAIHVGDTPGADVDGARAADVHPVLVDPYDFHPHLDVERVTSLPDVVELVRARQPA